MQTIILTAYSLIIDFFIFSSLFILLKRYKPTLLSIGRVKENVILWITALIMLLALIGVLVEVGILN